MQEWADFVQGIRQEATIVSTGRPVIIKDPKSPLVMLTLAEFKHYRWLMSQHHAISAAQAHKAANRAVLQDLVGCPWVQAIRNGSRSRRPIGKFRFTIVAMEPW